MRNTLAYAAHRIFQIYLWVILHWVITGLSSALCTMPRGVSEGNVWAGWTRRICPTFPPAIIIHKFILFFLSFIFSVRMIVGGKRWFFFQWLFVCPGYEYSGMLFHMDMNALNALLKRLYLSYKHPANNFLRGLKMAVENSSLGGFSRGEYGYDLLEIFLLRRETVPLIAHLDFSKSPFQ